MRIFLSTFFCSILLFAPFAPTSGEPQSAQSPSEAPIPTVTSADDVARERLDMMLRTGHVESAWFSDEFIAQVPATRVEDIIASVEKTLGEYRSLERGNGRLVARFANGTDAILIHLDSDERIDGLFFRPPILLNASLRSELHALQSPSGKLSYLILEGNGSELAALNPAVPLAVGSAFKLAVLNALQDEITNRSVRWSDVVLLKSEWKSLPSGILQTWPDGTPLTLATLAAEMISISDNTAADALIHVVDKKALGRYVAGNRPFLTTREMFILKSKAALDVRGAFMSVTTPAARQSILQRLDKKEVPAADQLMTSPDTAIEWHYSVRQLCALLAHVDSLPLMSINPGVADRASFRHVAFKGGSDVGIINLTTLVTTLRGTRICFSATLNDEAKRVDELSFEAAYGGVLRLLAAM